MEFLARIKLIFQALEVHIGYTDLLELCAQSIQEAMVEAPPADELISAFFSHIPTLW